MLAVVTFDAKKFFGALLDVLGKFFGQRTFSELRSVATRSKHCKNFGVFVAEYKIFELMT